MTDFEYYQLLLQVGSLVFTAGNFAVSVVALAFVVIDHFDIK